MLAFPLHLLSSQHQNRLPVDSHSMPKRRHFSVSVGGTSDDVCRGLVVPVVVMGSQPPVLEPIDPLVCDCVQMLPEHRAPWADFHGQSPAALASVTQATGNPTSLSRTVKHFQTMMQAPKLTKADAREWLTAMGESVNTTTSSAELKAKLLHISRDLPAELVLPMVVNSMPQRVLNKFVKWIIFQQKQAGLLVDATPCMIARKEEAIWRVFDQVKLFQQMETRLGDIVSRIVDKISRDHEAQSVGLQASQS
jgi:hypothetical protein